jgi:hypothetical protein
MRRLLVTGVMMLTGLGASVGLGVAGATTAAAATATPAWGCHPGAVDCSHRCDPMWGGCNDARHQTFCNQHRRDRDWNRRGSVWDRYCRGWS